MKSHKFFRGSSETVNTLEWETLKMHFYVYLIIMGLASLGLSAFSSFQISDPSISFISTAFAYIVSLLLTFILTWKKAEREYNERLDGLKKEHQLKIHKLKREHDTTTLEKTIRDGTQTLIKNALDYFKIENIKNEMGNSAAMQNLQLDKYGQIIELLADFSLILPDYKENQEIVEYEINHQIEIYKIDEKDFALFLQRIMKKYVITVNKKIREKKDLNITRNMKRCPKCAEKVLPQASVCKHCGHEFRPVLMKLPTKPMNELEWLRKGQTLYRSGNLQEALSLMTNAIDLNPKFAKAYYNRGIIHEKLGSKERAINDLRAASQLGYKKAQDVMKELNVKVMGETQEWKFK